MAEPIEPQSPDTNLQWITATRKARRHIQAEAFPEFKEDAQLAKTLCNQIAYFVEANGSEEECPQCVKKQNKRLRELKFGPADKRKNFKPY